MHGRLTTKPQATAVDDLDEGGGGGFDLRDILHFVWRNWLIMLSLALIGGAAGYINYISQTPVYTASADILLETRREKVAGPDAIMSEEANVAGTLENQVAVLRSTGFLRRVVERHRLQYDPSFGGAPLAPKPEAGGGSGIAASPEPATTVDLGLFEAVRSLYRSLRVAGHDLFGFHIMTGFEPPTSGGDQAVPPDVMRAIGALRGVMGVARQGQASILTITVTLPDPNKAARIANAIADSYVVEKLDARFEAARRASGWLSDRLADLREQLRLSEEAVVQYRQDHGLVRAGAVTLNEQQVADLNGKLIAARAEVADKKSQLDLLKEMRAKGESLEELPFVRTEALSRLRAQERDAAKREAELVVRYTDRHPQVVVTRSERRDLQRAIREELGKAVNQVSLDYELAVNRQEGLENVLREATGLATDDGMLAIRLRELERTASINKSLFEDFLQRAKITQEQSTFELREARVLTPATPPGAPSAPNRNRILGMGLLLGLMAGAGGAFAREKLRSGFITPQQIEQNLALPVLASINRMADGDARVDGHAVLLPHFVQAKPLSRFAEAFRSLRSGVQMADVDHPPKVVQVTSTLPSEGKTTVALCMAASAAASGQRTLFIDADLRHPSSSRFFGREKDKGLVDLLLGQVTLEDVLRPDEATGVWMLPCGSKTQNPADLLGSEKMKALLALFRAQFDAVIVDSPPVGPVIDPVVTSRIVDGVVYVVHWGTTARDMVQRCLAQVAGDDRVCGVVLNMVNAKHAKRYGRTDYYYYYGKNYYNRYYAE